MPLKISKRGDRDSALYIVGRIKLKNGTVRRIRDRAKSNNRKLAEEEAAALEAQILRNDWHGEKQGDRFFAEAVDEYLNLQPRGKNDQDRIARIMVALGNVRLSEVTQTALVKVRDKISPGCAPATFNRAIITPVRAIMRYAAIDLGWCVLPTFKPPKNTPGRTLYALPNEAIRLVNAASPHIKPLLIFILCVGARMAEAVELDWREVDLEGGRVTLRLKGGGTRHAMMPPAAVKALSALAHREGRVFRHATVEPKKEGKAAPRVRDYKDRNRQDGGHIKTAWRGARLRAALPPALAEMTPHDLRHTWASWHYAINKDLLLLKREGCWSSVTLVERYAHLMPQGQQEAIQAFWNGDVTLSPVMFPTVVTTPVRKKALDTTRTPKPSDNQVIS